jgi:hypothetical protein
MAPLISGQRCLKRELLAGFDEWGSGYGIETALNAHLLDRGVEPRIVEWDGAAQVMKEEKRGLSRGFTARMKMYKDVLRAWVRSKKKG